ncbi:MAG: PucR family transcriptional regulator, partial [Solirubrobacterales bacterium]
SETAEARLGEVAEALESGAGLPTAVRAAAVALGASLALIDRAGAVLAVAASSPAEEKRLLSIGPGVSVLALNVAGAQVGELRIRVDGGDPERAIDHAEGEATRVVALLLAQEAVRTQGASWAGQEAGSDFVEAVIARAVTDRGDIAARAAEAGADLGGGAGVIVARVAPVAPQVEEWRARALALALRGLRSVSGGAVAADRGDGERAEIAAIVPAGEPELLERAAAALERELEAGLPGFSLALGIGRRTEDPADLHRSGSEARLAVNVGEARGERVLAFEDSGSYRLLLSALSEDPDELERFFSETVLPLVSYDEQYATELVATVEAYLDSDGAVSATAEKLFTHRHTVRYRLDRVRELSGHDLSSTEGRERLSLGLKAMRVLGIAVPRSPARESAAEGSAGRRRGEGR